MLEQDPDLHRIEARIVVRAPAAVLWRIYTDVPGWSCWDPDTRKARLDGPFVPGARGRLWPRKGLSVPMVLTEAEPERSFTVECPVFGSRMRFDHELSPVDAEKVEVVHRVQFSGWLAPWLWRTVGEDVRKGLPVTLASLQRHAQAQRANMQEQDAAVNIG